MEIIRFHLKSRQGAGNGGCQERSLVMNGRLLLSNLNVRHFTSLNSFMGFLFLVTISVCGISSTNQSLNLSFFSAFLANFVIRLILLLCSVLIFVSMHVQRICIHLGELYVNQFSSISPACCSQLLLSWDPKMGRQPHRLI